MAGKKWVSGFHAIEEILSSGEKKGEIIFSKQNRRIDTILELAGRTGIGSRKAGRDELDRVAGSENHRGILFIYSGKQSEDTIKSSGKIKYRSLEDFLDNIPDRDNILVLLLDGVTDPHNLGAILRSADLFDVDLVVHPQKGSAGDSSVVRNVSAGAASWVSMVSVTNLSRAVKSLKDSGFWIYGAMMDGERADRVNLKGRTAIIMGSEGKGLRRLVAEGCDGFISIPIGGHIDSLNVSVAAGILLYEARRQSLG